MNHLITYVNSPLVSLLRFEHGFSEPHRDPPEETVSYYSINVIERGSFTLHIGHQSWQMASGMVFNTRPDLRYHCRHADEFPQCVCFSISFKKNFADELLMNRRSAPNQLMHVAPLNNRLAYLYMRLRGLSAGCAEVLQAEVLAGELLAAVAHGDETGSYRLYKSHQLAWYMERVEAARTLMETQYGAPHTLASLARFAGMSPFHFARIFRELTGMPPHRYLLKTRLERAAELLREGSSVTETCFASGFNNLSHFTRVFQRAYGYSPAQFAGKRKVYEPEAAATISTSK
jgi:AraC-like DNA-binding protein